MSASSEIKATIVRNMVAAGAHVLCMTKLSSMIGKEEPTEATDINMLRLNLRMMTTSLQLGAVVAVQQQWLPMTGSILPLVRI